MSELAECTKSDQKRGSMVAGWILGPFLAAINEKNLLPEQSKVTAESFAELIKLIGEGKVSNLAAKDVFAKMFVTGEDPSNILDELGLHQVSDESVILEAVKKVIAANQARPKYWMDLLRSEEHTSELQSPDHLVCRLLLEKKKTPT